MPNDTTAERQQTQMREIADKLALERKLQRKLLDFFSELGALAAETFSLSGSLPQFKQKTPQLATILREHYAMVADRFDNKLVKSSGVRIKNPDSVSLEVHRRLAQPGRNRAQRQADLIMATAIKTIERSFQKAQNQLVEQGDIDPPPGNVDEG